MATARQQYERLKETPSDAAAKLQAELDELRKQAAAARERAAAGGAAGTELNLPDAAAVKRAAVTFSAAGLLALGQGGGVQERMARALEQIDKRHERELAALDKLAARPGAVFV